MSDKNERPVSLFPTTDRLATPADGPEAVVRALSEQPTNRAAAFLDYRPFAALVPVSRSRFNWVPVNDVLCEGGTAKDPTGSMP